MNKLSRKEGNEICLEKWEPMDRPVHRTPCVGLRTRARLNSGTTLLTVVLD